jgi:copper transport protein
VSRARARRALAVLAAGLLTAAALPSGASAHAQLERTAPPRGALVATQPASVSLTFDESVAGAQGAVRVFDARGSRVDDGDAFHPGGDGRTFAVRLRRGLAKGTYTATYRIVSADTHVVTGGFTFAIGSRGAGAGESVGRLVGGQETGTVTSSAFVAARAVQFAAIGVGGGLLAFLAFVWLPALAGTAGGTAAWAHASRRFVARLRGALLLAALAGVLSALAGLGLEGAEASGVPFWRAWNATVLDGVLGTRFGAVWTAGTVAWLLVAGGAAALLAPRSSRAPVLRPVSLGADGAALSTSASRGSLIVLAAPLLALLALPALAGHASVQSPVWLFAPVNVLHVAAMAVWLGGLVALLAALPAATRSLDAPDRAPLLAAGLARFSPLALACVVVLAATGTVQSLLEIDAWSQLPGTAFGREVLIKILLLLWLIGLGAVNRRRTLPRLRAIAARAGTPGAAGLLLRRTLRVELAVLAVVLAITGALAGAAPAKDADTGPVQLTSTLGPAQLSLDVDPARAGANEIHVYLLDPRTGAQYTATKELTVTASLPAKGIGPLPLQAQATGPGHYTLPGAVLAAPGTWTLDLVARVSDFDQFERKLKVRIR